MSPAATLSDHEATDSILATADELFYERGVNAVTMAELRDAAGVSMRRLYSLYPTKADVVTAWLKDRHASWTRGFATEVDRRVATGENPVVAVFGYLEAWMIATDYRGCGFINTHAGAAGYTAEQRETVRLHKSSVERYLTRLVPTVPGLAVVVDGAIVQASIYRSPEPIRAARELTRQLTAESPTTAK